MATPVWSPGTLYQPGALVRPRTTPPTVQSAPTNPGFETGDLTGWTVGDPLITVQTTPGFAFEGVSYLRHAANLFGVFEVRNTNIVPVTPGMSITAHARYRRDTNVTGRQTMHMVLFWLDAGMADLSQSTREYLGGATGVWYDVTVTGAAPPGAAFAQLGIFTFNDNAGGPHAQYFDAFTWDYTFANAPDGLIFRAVQTLAGFSANVEPTWPTVLGVQVIDNEVTWEAVSTSRVVWEASPILVSGAVEPVFPIEIDATVADNTIAWRAISRRIEDARCPNTKVVAIAASKIFAADDDIIPFCATINPLDWSTPDDAGYLPFGLQTYGSNPVTAMGLYRSNLIAFNSMGFQMWQVDQDPASMALLDAVPIGCTFARSVQPVSNDLVFLTDQGIRNVGIAGASTNLQAGDFGKQIDPLVIPAIALGAIPRGLYVPALGQYWLFFGAEAFVLTMNGGKEDMSWSRYEFPAPIDDWTVLGDDLLLRAGELVWLVSEDALVDDEGGADEPFEGVIAWQYLDMGQLGVSKQLHGFDLVGVGEVAVSFGFDQTNFALETPPYTVQADTLTGGIIPMPLTGPSFQLRLRFSADQAWEMNAVNLYLQDLRRAS